MRIDIRPEKPSDYETIADIVRAAFEGEAEVKLVEKIRQSPDFIRELSRVAEIQREIVGHILFSPVTLETPNGNLSILSLAPLAVKPEFQNQGIGTELVIEGLKACQKTEYEIVVVLGHPNYYPRFGFTPAHLKGIRSPLPVPEEAFMVIELIPGGLKGKQGTVRYPPAFNDV